MSQRVVSERFPYVSVRVEFESADAGSDHDALLDTGFDGYVAAPSDAIPTGLPPKAYLRWQLADGSEVRTPTYAAWLQIGAFPRFPVLIIALGDEMLIGQAALRRFRVTLDHGQHVIVEE